MVRKNSQLRREGNANDERRDVSDELKDGENFQRGREKFQRDREGSLIGLLCSRNARSRTPLVGRAQWETDSGYREAHLAHEGVRETSKLGMENHIWEVLAPRA
jgi:hypothetical protein